MANIETLFPCTDASPEPARRLNLLTRSAASAPLDSTGHLTQYRPVQSRSIISRVVSKRGMPFTHAINPYRGCEFACRYCYARYAHEFMELTPEDFEHKIFFKENAGWLVAQELAHLKPGTHIALGTATDPWQPIERRHRIARSIVEAFARSRGFSLGIVTKSTLILRDIDLLKEVARRHKLTVHLTVTTMDTALARIIEPRAPRPDLRIWTLQRLRGAGIRAGVLCSPVMPGITDSRKSIEAVARAAAEAGASFFAANPLFLKQCSLPTFFKFVEEHFPGQIEAYRQRYGTNAFVSKEYSGRIADLVAAICRQYKLGRRYESMSPAGEIAPPELVQIQASLPFSA
jgi:DNA repair photolyase